jgi:hypothetical protein
MKKLLAASLCMFIVAACAAGGSKKSAMHSAPSAAQTTDAAGEPQMAVDSPKGQLDHLFAEVEQERQQMGLPEAVLDPGAQTFPAAEPTRTPQTDATCKPAPSETCTTSCTLSGSICKNKDRICELAKDLGDDDSLGKCNKATKTCKTAADKCCSCML